jgi:formylglycine-generating enzyme required for sulfatase activity
MKAENPTQIKKSKRLFNLYRMYRGGNWRSYPYILRASHRISYDMPSGRYYNVGFRLVRNK